MSHINPRLHLPNESYFFSQLARSKHQQTPTTISHTHAVLSLLHPISTTHSKASRPITPRYPNLTPLRLRLHFLIFSSHQKSTPPQLQYSLQSQHPTRHKKTAPASRPTHKPRNNPRNHVSPPRPRPLSKRRHLRAPRDPAARTRSQPPRRRVAVAHARRSHAHNSPAPALAHAPHLQS